MDYNGLKLIAWSQVVIKHDYIANIFDLKNPLKSIIIHGSSLRVDRCTILCLYIPGF